MRGHSEKRLGVRTGPKISKHSGCVSEADVYGTPVGQLCGEQGTVAGEQWGLSYGMRKQGLDNSDCLGSTFMEIRQTTACCGRGNYLLEMGHEPELQHKGCDCSSHTPIPQRSCRVILIHHKLVQREFVFLFTHPRIVTNLFDFLSSQKKKVGRMLVT